MLTVFYIRFGLSVEWKTLFDFLSGALLFDEIGASFRVTAERRVLRTGGARRKFFFSEGTGEFYSSTGAIMRPVVRYPSTLITVCFESRSYGEKTGRDSPA